MESSAGELTVSDLVRGWDDVRLLLTTTDPDQVWDVVSARPAQRLATALVSAVAVMGPDDADAGSRPLGAEVVVTGHASGVRGGGGQVSDHMAAAEWPQ